MTDARTDDDLMLAYGRGDVQAFEVLYERYRQPLYRYLYHALGHRALADDLYQDIWSRLIDARARFHRGNGFKRYLFRMAHNRLVDHWRQLDHQRPAPDHYLECLSDDAERSPEAHIQRYQRAEKLHHALQQLPPEQRQAFLLQQEAGLSLADIAEHDGIGRETVKSRLRYAVRRLRQLLKPETTPAQP